MTITDGRITSDRTPAQATARPDAAGQGHGAWGVSWLPQRVFDRDQAITAMVLAETLTPGLTPGAHAWPLVESLAGELGLTAAEAQSAMERWQS